LGRYRRGMEQMQRRAEKKVRAELRSGAVEFLLPQSGHGLPVGSLTCVGVLMFWNTLVGFYIVLSAYLKGNRTIM